MKIWKLRCIVSNEHDYNIETFYFIDQIKAEKFKDTYAGSKNTQHIAFDLLDVEFEDIKDSLTISQYEKLFNTHIDANYRLSIADFKERMWVWNNTEEVYQRLRYVLKKDDYHWVDSYGRIIENDEIYRYQIEEN